MPRRTAEQAEKTRQLLIQVARRQFANGGFENVTLEAVADEAHVTRGAVYHHFGGKPGLFAKVLEQLMQDIGEFILKAADSGRTPFEALELGCVGFIEFAQRNEYIQIAMLDAPRVLGVQTWQALDDEATTASLREGLRDAFASTPEADIEALAQSLSGAMNQITLWASTGPWIDEADTLNRAKRATRMLLAGVRATIRN